MCVTDRPDLFWWTRESLWRLLDLRKLKRTHQFLPTVGGNGRFLDTNSELDDFRYFPLGLHYRSVYVPCPRPPCLCQLSHFTARRKVAQHLGEGVQNWRIRVSAKRKKCWSAKMYTQTVPYVLSGVFHTNKMLRYLKCCATFPAGRFVCAAKPGCGTISLPPAPLHKLHKMEKYRQFSYTNIKNGIPFYREWTVVVY